jgi:prepilin-type N-terminal cleavage/methylation domain-containing protein
MIVAKRPSRESGVTLVELMVVIAIAAVLALAIGRGMARPNNATAVDDWTQKVLIAMRQAHNTAVHEGAVVRVVVTAGNLTVDRASMLGPGPPAGSAWLRLAEEQARGTARTYAVDTSPADPLSPLPSAGTGLPATFSFNPDGSATPGTVLIQDDSATYRYKVLVFGLTGYSMRITRW